MRQAKFVVALAAAVSACPLHDLAEALEAGRAAAGPHDWPYVADLYDTRDALGADVSCLSLSHYPLPRLRHYPDASLSLHVHTSPTYSDDGLRRV